jgi:hypothetical protein
VEAVSLVPPVCPSCAQPERRLQIASVEAHA